MSASCRYCDPSIPGIDGMCLEHLRAEAHRLRAENAQLAGWAWNDRKSRRGMLCGSCGKAPLVCTCKETTR